MNIKLAPPCAWIHQYYAAALSAQLSVDGRRDFQTQKKKNLIDDADRNTAVHVRDFNVPRLRARASQRSNPAAPRSDAQRARRESSRGGPPMFQAGQALRDGWHAPRGLSPFFFD